MSKVKTAIIGPGNIGSDMMYKILRSDSLELEMVAGVVESEGIERAKGLGIKTSIKSADDILKNKDIKIVFDATSAKPATENAPLFREAGLVVIDTTPAEVGKFVVPCVNLKDIQDEPNFNLITCGGQATIPIIYALSRVAEVRYAEIIAGVASKSAGLGTRHNIDEFTQTTAKAIVQIGGAKKGKAINIFNPAEPPIIMTNTIMADIVNPDEKELRESVEAIVMDVQKYVPGYQLRVPPIVEDGRVTTTVQVEGAGDFLPKYSGNLDIMTAAAVAVGEYLAKNVF